MINQQLFWWMSNVGQGTNQRLFDAVQALQSNASSVNVREWSRFYLNSVIRLGHITVPKANTWQMRPPALAMCADGQRAFARGGLSPQKLADLKKEVLATSQPFPDKDKRPDLLYVFGSPKEIEEIAQRFDFGFELEPMAGSLSRLKTIENYVKPSSLPTTNTEKLSLRWPLEDSLISSKYLVWKFEPENSNIRYFIKTKKDCFETNSPWTSIYYAAKNQQQLCRYDENTRCFEADENLPIDYAQALCLCSGTLPEKRQSTYIFRDIPPVIGLNILKLLGQDNFVPTIRWF